MIKKYFILTFFLMFLGFWPVFSQNTTWYVAQNGTGNGSSWALASNNLQTVLDNAVAGDKVWIKQGTYQRAEGLTFSLNADVSIFGGFPAIPNPTLNDRNPKLYETILEGNQAGVLQVSGVFEPLIASTIIDGLTIKNGYANGAAGISIYNCDATFRNLKVSDNISAMGLGAGIGMTNSNSTFIQVLVCNNTSQLNPGGDGDTGGIRINGGSPSFYNCVVADNHAEGSIGGIWIVNTTCHFYNSIVYGNTADVPTADGWDDNLFPGQNAVLYASHCILENCKGSDYLMGTPQFAYYGIDLGGNHDVDPLFNADYSLQPASVGINKGNTQAYLAAPNSFAKDYYNNIRVVDLVDIGLSEYQSVQSQILYVKENGTGDGSSWANASGDLQLMMDKQFSGRSVWVAEGTYYAPDPYFKLREGVQLYGGFPATGTPAFADRDATLHETILTSTYLGIIANYHPENKNISSATQVDGFVITKNANSPVEMFGIIESNSDVAYSNSTFKELNYSAAFVRDDSHNSFTDCNFLDNYALDDEFHTVSLHFGAHASFLRCNFTGNYAFSGSAMWLKHNSYALIEECLFANNNNNVISSVGKVIAVINSSAKITNSVFDANGYSAAGGPIVSISGHPDQYDPTWTHPVEAYIDRCIFKNNLNGAITAIGKAGDLISISNSLFYKNTDSSGAAISKGFTFDMYITNCTFTENHASSQWAGAIYISDGGGVNHIRNSIIYNNSSVYPYAPDLWTSQPISFKNTLLATSGGSANWNAGGFNNFDVAPLAIDLGGNMDVNPLFVDSANDDYHLSEESPALNAGENSFYNAGTTPDLALFTTDLENNERIQDTTVDLGAYEFEPLLGTEPIEMTNGITLYPNPTEAFVTIRSADSAVEEVRIYSILGKELIVAKKETVDLSTLSEGVYIVKIMLANDKSYSSKLIKK